MIERAKFLQVDVDVKTYNRILRVIERLNAGTFSGGTSDLVLPSPYLDKLMSGNDFLRIKCMEYYADLKISTWRSRGEFVVVSFSGLIDYNRFVILGDKKNN